MMNGTRLFSRFIESDANAKVYWKPLDGSPVQTTVMPGRGVETFKTAAYSSSKMLETRTIASNTDMYCFT